MRARNIELEFTDEFSASRQERQERARLTGRNAMAVGGQDGEVRWVLAQDQISLRCREGRGSWPTCGAELDNREWSSDGRV